MCRKTLTIIRLWYQELPPVHHQGPHRKPLLLSAQVRVPSIGFHTFYFGKSKDYRRSSCSERLKSKMSYSPFRHLQTGSPKPFWEKMDRANSGRKCPWVIGCTWRTLWKGYRWQSQKRWTNYRRNLLSPNRLKLIQILPWKRPLHHSTFLLVKLAMKFWILAKAYRKKWINTFRGRWRRRRRQNQRVTWM